jgi:FemAB-related protein (PEP-CTERM system-associated)
MMTNIKIESYNTPPAGWNEFVETHREGKIYHLAEWNQLVHRTFGHTIEYITLTRDEKMVGLLPLTEFKSLLFGHFSVSLPFINYGGPLLSDPELMDPLSKFLAGMRSDKKYDYIELRFDSVRESALPTKQHKVTFFMDLPADSEELWNSFKAKLRSQIRRPMKENMNAESGGVELVEDFYRIFAINMRELGTPVLPKSFFKNILQEFSNDAYIVVIYTENGEAVAASFLIRYNNVLEIPWASSLREYNRYSPNMLLYWESLKLAVEEGCKVFDFGRCTPDSGTYKFKKQWNSRELPLCWAYVLPNGETLPELHPENHKFSLAIKIWTKLPLGVTKILGPKIIKNIP